MVKIVGIDEKEVKRITCKCCARILEYTLSEVRILWEGKDYSGGPDGAKGFTCPGCGKDVITERW